MQLNSRARKSKLTSWGAGNQLNRTPSLCPPWLSAQLPSLGILIFGVADKTGKIRNEGKVEVDLHFAQGSASPKRYSPTLTTLRACIFASSVPVFHPNPLALFFRRSSSSSSGLPTAPIVSPSAPFESVTRRDFLNPKQFSVSSEAINFYPPLFLSQQATAKR